MEEQVIASEVINRDASWSATTFFPAGDTPQKLPTDRKNLKYFRLCWNIHEREFTPEPWNH